MKKVLERVIEHNAALEKEMGFDWRSTWSRAVPDPAGSVVMEISRKEILERVASGVEGFDLLSSGDGEVVLRSTEGIGVTFRLAGSSGGKVLWVVSSVADLRRGPDHGAELITQAIMGETLTPLEHRGDWFFVRMDDDYHGWVRSWYVAETDSGEVSSFLSSADSRIEASVAYVLSAPVPASIPVTDVTAGTPVKTGVRQGDLIEVALPGGKAGYVVVSALESPALSSSLRERIIERAAHFAGITYVWGGTCGKGFDCSGLIKRVFLMEGMSLPRDADQQSAVGARIPLGEVDRALAGDLLFFGENGRITHVAIAMGDGRFIHAYGDVRVNSYRPGDPLFEEKLAGKLLFATRPIEG
ncbi:MAG TPA: NlpC/P60 family protein [Candidatus Krumholzibacterium sp.]|nr:NlpC/P60 family protein [Candidatus Krumholzibacterium sp.]